MFLLAASFDVLNSAANKQAKKESDEVYLYAKKEFGARPGSHNYLKLYSTFKGAADAGTAFLKKMNDTLLTASVGRVAVRINNVSTTPVAALLGAEKANAKVCQALLAQFKKEKAAATAAEQLRASRQQELDNVLRELEEELTAQIPADAAAPLRELATRKIEVRKKLVTAERKQRDLLADTESVQTQLASVATQLQTARECQANEKVATKRLRMRVTLLELSAEKKTLKVELKKLTKQSSVLRRKLYRLLQNLEKVEKLEEEQREEPGEGVDPDDLAELTDDDDEIGEDDNDDDVDDDVSDHDEN